MQKRDTDNIRRGENIGDDAYAVAEFVEKPDFDTACHYLDTGRYTGTAACSCFARAVT